MNIFKSAPTVHPAMASVSWKALGKEKDSEVARQQAFKLKMNNIVAKMYLRADDIREMLREVLSIYISAISI